VSKTVVIHQPDFLPYLGFFHRLLAADLFVILDTVQFATRGWTHRDKIKTPQGEDWITISVSKAPRDAAIRDIRVSDAVDWRSDNLNLIRTNYQKARFFPEIYPLVEELYSYKCGRLMDFNMKSIDMLLALLDVQVPTVLASELGVVGRKN